MTLSLHNLRPASGSRHRRKRLGRGNASGHGTYSTRGQKGQRARSGGRKGLKRMGLRRLALSTPKLRGFRSLKQLARPIHLRQLDRLVKSGELITTERLVEWGLIKTPRQPVKILSDGAISKAITIQGIPLSAAATEKIIAAGGRVES
ncbi:50S ribosomal protein L15 [Candidatus Uhrbacteria bacterium]|nr:50S ribosomal protein L15 [Candidatus Uhrbacteria bacterium]